MNVLMMSLVTRVATNRSVAPTGLMYKPNLYHRAYALGYAYITPFGGSVASA